MKNMKLLTTALVLSVAMFSCKQTPEGDKAKTGDAKEVTNETSSKALNVNTTESTLAWIGAKVTKQHEGTIQIKSGQLHVDGAELTGGNFVIDMPTMVLLNEDEKTTNNLGGHLMSPDFFDVEKYPESKFEITDVKPFSGTVVTDNTQKEESGYKVTDPNVVVSGNLTIKDVTKNIEFPAKVDVTDNSATAMAKFSINRKDWGVVYPGMPDDLIRDEIWFGVSLTAN